MKFINYLYTYLIKKFVLRIFIFTLFFTRSTNIIFANISDNLSTANIVSAQEKNDFSTQDDPTFQVTIKDDNNLFTLFRNIFVKESQNITDKLSINVKDPFGNTVNPEHIKITNNNNIVQIDINKDFLTPGKYSVDIIDKQSHEIINKDFSWGVLTINTNKSLYKTNDVANFAIAVLDETGDMVCDADVELKIYTPDDKLITLSTSNNAIQSSPQCYLKEVTLIPDYISQFLLSTPGNYKINLTATTTNGQHSIEDSFTVEDNPIFNIEHITATRIFPLQKYPVIHKIKSNSDFNGYIVDSVPIDFKINSSQPLNIKIENNRQNIYWPVNIKADQEISLNYEYDAPDISPEIFTIGPIKLINQDEQLVYEDSRLWQIASDNIYDSITFTNVGATNWTVPTNVYSITVQAWGAGGGGGDGTNNGGGGGGGGAYVATTIAVIPGTIYNINIGAGGAGATTTGGSGTKGGNTTFGSSILTAIGGNGGGNNAGGTGGQATASIGSTKFNGGNGGNGNNTSDGGGGGGGSAGPNGNGIIGGNATTTIGGNGGAGNNGLGGAGGAGGNGANGTVGTSNSLGGGGGGGGDNGRYGANGGAPGAGGGGGETQSTTINGKGGDGRVFISYFINEIPNAPTNTSPSNGLTGQSANTSLSTSAFSDPDTIDSHSNSQWQVATDTAFSSIVWDSGPTPANLTTNIINSTNGTFQGLLSGQFSLNYLTTYYWRVRYQDNYNNWSSYSSYTSFTTSSPPPAPPSFKINGVKLNGIKFQ